MASGIAPEAVRAVVAQLVERVLGKDEVTSSILVIGSSVPARESAPGRATAGVGQEGREIRTWPRRRDEA